MNRKQYLAAVAAAEAELARLQAIVPEPDVPLMVLSAERMPHGSEYHAILFSGVVQAIVDDNKAVDILAHEAAAYYSSKAQAEAYARTFRTLRLIRRQPGIVAEPTEVRDWLYYIVTVDGAVAVRQITGCHSTACMFPCFDSRAAAQAAINAVGEDELVFTANFLAGNITLDDYAASTQPAAQTGEQT